ncbi:restriction endonuclease subunit S [Comamonas sp. MYb396]|uniref:restriction endonuclease subunit S n=1 Tax=Comamonas sp. MYb396 TaxID=2745302 RepID=UPI0030986F45
MSTLPTGWVIATIPEVAEVLDSLRVPLNANERALKVNGKNVAELIPYFGATGQVGYTDSYLFNEDIVLLGEDGVPFLDVFKKKAYRVSGKSWVNNHAHVLRAKILDWRLLESQLNCLSYVGYVSGSTRLKLTQASMNKLPVIVPPQNEQLRIADKLDTVLTRVDALNDRLARITPLLKRFRQSVLAAATSGRLTEDWREETQLTTAWPLISLSEVAKDFSYGSAAKSSKVGDIPVLRMGNIKNGSLDWQDLVYTSDELEINKYRLCVGDVLFNRTNSPDLVGKTAVFKGEREAVYAGYLIRVKCSEKLDADFLNYCLGSPAGRDYCWKVKSDGVSQSNINAKKLAAFEFELPSIEEQTEIVRRVEILFAYADRLEARLQTARTAADRLTPALLAKAFRGELVPQDPNDEPATELLRRLREARAAEAPAKKTRGRKAVV